MKTITISLSDDSVALMERSARARDMSLETAVALEVESRIVPALKRCEQGWMPEARWDALIRGEDCPMCRSLATPAHDGAITIVDLAISRLQLMRNQFVPGYSVLICREHVIEPYELDVARQQLFFADVMRAARAIAAALKPTKMNFEILGNRTPHLHCHIKPRYFGDSAPEIPIDQNAGCLMLAAEEYDRLVRTIRTNCQLSEP